MKYIEIGLGNTWFIRTEIELQDGTEIEQKGIITPILFESLYIRLWLHKTVFIVSSKEGFKKQRKQRKAFKILFGIVSRTSI